MRGDWADAGETVLRVDGGMCINNWAMQRLADMLGAEVDRPQVLESTALGAAWLAGMQAGIYPDMQGFSKNWALEQRFTPAKDDSWRAAKYDGWKDAISRTLSQT
jgi:glycerol kinase